MRVERNGDVLRLVLDRAAKRNALDLETIAGLRAAVATRGPRVIRLEAEGPSWCAGADLAAVMAHPGGRGAAMHQFADALADLAESPVPVVAVIDAAVLGGGVGLLCAADLAIAGPRATVSLPESRVGAWPMMVGALLARVTTPRLAMDLALTGRKVEAEEGLRIGLFSRLAEDPATVADEACAAILARSPAAARAGREAWRQHA
ncbi:MAG: enoyl-CoA hydratase/isomerase family protein, partial [Deltaproteobacteria bacterium]|nr:enoyl-CoA hydratase/isomerase family protein [Deltaproteobacteria bacterium]